MRKTIYFYEELTQAEKELIDEVGAHFVSRDMWDGHGSGLIDLYDISPAVIEDEQYTAFIAATGCEAHIFVKMAAGVFGWMLPGTVCRIIYDMDDIDNSVDIPWIKEN